MVPGKCDFTWRLFTGYIREVFNVTGPKKLTLHRETFIRSIQVPLRMWESIEDCKWQWRILEGVTELLSDISIWFEGDLKICTVFYYIKRFSFMFFMWKCFLMGFIKYIMSPFVTAEFSLLRVTPLVWCIVLLV